MSSAQENCSLFFIRNYVFPITERETCLKFKADDLRGPYKCVGGSSSYGEAVADFMDEQRRKKYDSIFHFIRMFTYHDECKTQFSIDIKKGLVEGLCNILPAPFLHIKGEIKPSKGNKSPVFVDKHFDLIGTLESIKETRTNEYNEHFSVERIDQSGEKSLFKFNIFVRWKIDSPKHSIQEEKLVTIQNSEYSAFQSLFGEEATKDLTLVTEDGVEVKCHRIIFEKTSILTQLGSSSSSSSSSTSTEKKMSPSEKGLSPFQKDRVELKDISKIGLRHLLRYLYGMDLVANNLSPDLSLELFKTAHKYNLTHLQGCLYEFFMEKEKNGFTPKLIFNLYQYTKTSSDFVTLKDHTLRIMTCMKTDQLKSCDGFKKLNRDEAIDLLCKLIMLLQEGKS